MTAAMLLLGVLVVVPAALPLHPSFSWRSSWIAAFCALPVVPAFVLDPGAMAAMLTAPWLLATTGLAFSSLRCTLRGHATVLAVSWPVATAYLAFGAGWLVFDRIGVEPAGVTDPFVLLTAVHFHYAGFVGTTMAACARRRAPRTATTVALGATATAPPLIAAGFAAVPVLQVLGAVLLTGGLWTLAWVTVRSIAPDLPAAPRVLLITSSLSVLVPMVLAVQWAVGANFGTPALSVPDMARTHGLVNAVGFSLLGVLGWRLVAGLRSPTGAVARDALEPDWMAGGNAPAG